MDKFCSKCGQKLPENATFCTNCGSPVPNQNTYSTPNQATYTKPEQNVDSNPNTNMYGGSTQNSNPNMYGGSTQNSNPNMYGGAPNMNQNMYGGNPNMYQNQNVDPKVASNNSLATVISVVGLMLSFIGSILFGVFLSVPALILGIIGSIMAVNVKKASNNVKGTPAMVCGILAIVLASIFSVGCMSCNVFGYGCYGVAGGSCKAANDVSDGVDDFRDAWEEEMEDYGGWFN